MGVFREMEKFEMSPRSALTKHPVTNDVKPDAEKPEAVKPDASKPEAVKPDEPKRDLPKPPSGKWISGTSAEAPADKMVRRALQTKLTLTLKALPLAAEYAEHDPEYVHALRVSTRRAAAAVETFRDFLPKKRMKRWLKRLKNMRRAAGDARDADVLGMRLKALALEHPADDWQRLIDEVDQQRQAAQKPIVKLDRKLPAAKQRRRLRKLLNGVESSDSMTFGALGRLEVDSRLKSLSAAEPVESWSHEQLHALRIEAKAVRYAMELFAGAFPPKFRRDLYPVVEEAQELLGQVNDHAVALSLFRDWRSASTDPALSQQLDDLIAHEESSLASSRDSFFTFWRSGSLQALPAQFTALPFRKPRTKK